MASHKKDVLIEELAQRWTDEMDMDSLLSWFCENQETYLRSLTETEFFDIMIENDMIEETDVIE